MDGATLCEIGLGESDGGTSLINLDFGTGTTAVTGIARRKAPLLLAGRLSYHQSRNRLRTERSKF